MLGSRFLRNAVRRFGLDRAGNIAPAFAISMLPLTLSVGAAVDYSRLANVEGRLQAASDTVALYISKELENGTSTATIKSKMHDIFLTALRDSDIKTWTADYEYDAASYTVVVEASAQLDTIVLGLGGVDTMSVDVSSAAVNGSDYVELALVLDNTGSMASSGKLTQLKVAAKTMIGQLANTPSGKAGKTSVAIIPFGVPVNIGTANDSATWLGPKKTTTTCKWVNGVKVCTTTTDVWSGCVGDRVSPFTVVNTQPTGGSSNYPRFYGTCSLTTLMPLTTNLTAASTKIDAMIATGNTNIPVGVMWGWNMLTPGAPLSAASTAAPDKRILRYMIVLTDGENTQNTLGSSGTTIDTLTKDTCTNVKKAGITVFTIRVIDGDEALLKNCASSEAFYYNVNDSKMLTSVFQQIMANITKLRLSS
jgi:Flp pilus assembly protein TadG